MPRRFLIIAILILSLGASWAEARKVRLSLKNPPTETPARRRGAAMTGGKMVELDSLRIAALADSVSFAGFDKVAQSTKETFYVSNDSGRPIGRITVDITYRDMSGRMLHRREESIEVDLPQGETRMVSIPAYDRQKSLYYYKSRAPRSGGMPFRVEIRLTGAAIPR